MRPAKGEATICSYVEMNIPKNPGNEVVMQMFCRHAHQVLAAYAHSSEKLGNRRHYLLDGGMAHTRYAPKDDGMTVILATTSSEVERIVTDLQDRYRGDPGQLSVEQSEYPTGPW